MDRPTPSERLRVIASAIEDDTFTASATPNLPRVLKGYFEVQRRQAERLRELADELEK